MWNLQGSYPHPFQDVLDKLEYVPSQLEFGCCQKPEALEWTPFLYIDTQEGLDEFAGQLKGVQEIAVDLEAHHFRSFQGLTCLMQVSLPRPVPYHSSTIIQLEIVSKLGMNSAVLVWLVLRVGSWLKSWLLRICWDKIGKMRES